MPGQTINLHDAETFSQLYSRTHLIVYRFIFGLYGGPQEEVEDFTAETYMRAWKTRSRFSGDADAALGWLIVIARNLVIDQHRKTKSRGTPQELDRIVDHVQLNPEDISPEEQLIIQDNFKLLWACVQNLPAEKREIIVLRYFLNWPVKRIAEHLDMLENTVSVTIRRTLARMRNYWPDNQQET